MKQHNSTQHNLKQHYFTKKATAFLLTLCMVLSCFGQLTTTSAKAADSTTVYFLNSKGWSDIGAYVYGVGEALGGWPGSSTQDAPELDPQWRKVTVPASPVFSIIFFNKANNSQRAELQIPSASSVYVTGSNRVYSSARDAEQAEGITNTTVYFLNTKNWSNVNAYVYGVGEALGGWPGTATLAASELGDQWRKVIVPAAPSFSIIFFDKNNDSQRAELIIPSASSVYVTASNQVYASAQDAGRAEGIGGTTIYFLNSGNWSDVNAYVYGGCGEVLGGWPGVVASSASEIGAKWMKVTVPAEPDFSIIFFDKNNDSQRAELIIPSKTSNYVSLANQSFGSAAEAEASINTQPVTPPTITVPAVTADPVYLSGVGASLPYITYEAETAATNAQVLGISAAYQTDIQSEASGRQAVRLSNTGDYVEFTLTEAANALVLRYCMPDGNNGTGITADLTLYVNGQFTKDVSLTSKYAWIYGDYPYTNNPWEGKNHRFFDEARLTFDNILPTGTRIRLQKDWNDYANYYIVDFIECETIGNAISRPANSLSVTDYGAVANDGWDDYNAFAACIRDARDSGKIVWIPAGTFTLSQKIALEAANVTIQGAGMWYTTLEGAGASFHYSGSCKFSDFSIMGVSTIRKDSEDLAAFEGVGNSNNVIILNIWIEHTKVGVWSYNTTNLMVQGCRIRNTYADGINLCSGTHGATIQNNNFRNTGDDCIAIWPWMDDCTNNTIRNNTIQLPTLANGIAIYGGAENTVTNNLIYDTIANGAGICVGSEFSTKYGFHGNTTVTGNIIDRCGSYHSRGYALGGLWIWNSNELMNHATYDISNNQIYNCTYSGVLIDCFTGLSGLTLKDLTIYNVTNALAIRGNAYGSATVQHIVSGDLRNDFFYNESQNFTVNWN